ncbi:MAG: trigger factor [Alloprevotella sp.]|nr:trigger factor [Alloprevotella sp.]
MNIQFEKNEETVSGKITIQLEKADYEAKVGNKLKEYSKKAQMPGFRPGKVPVGLIKKMYGTQAKAEEVNEILQNALFNYIKENKINILGQPLGNEEQEPQDIEKQDDFTFIFDIALEPEIKVELNADDTLPFYEIEVSDEDVEGQLKTMRSQAGHSEEVEDYQDNDFLRGTLCELDAEGNAPLEGGIVVEGAALLPNHFANNEEAKLFEGAKKNDVVVFTPATAYEGRDTEIATLLKVSKEEVANHTGKFSFQIDSISRFMPAELNEEFLKGVFGEEAGITTEEQAREAIKAQIAKVQEADSSFKLLLDAKKYFCEKAGDVKFPDALLKRIMKDNNQDKEESFVEDNYDASIKELKWDLVRNALCKQLEIKVEKEDLKAAAVEATRFQFMQYGINNIPEEYVEHMAEDMLKKENQVQGLFNRALDSKLSAKIKETAKLDKKTVSKEEFNKLFAE